MALNNDAIINTVTISFLNGQWIIVLKPKRNKKNAMNFRSFIRPLRGFATQAASRDSSGLKEAISSKIGPAVAEAKDVRSRYDDKQMGTCTVAQAYGGMRSVKSMTYETSLLDTADGIRFRGLTLPDCQRLLPKAKDGKEPLPEGLFWLLLTGDVPSAS